MNTWTQWQHGNSFFFENNFNVTKIAMPIALHREKRKEFMRDRECKREATRKKKGAQRAPSPYTQDKMHKYLRSTNTNELNYTFIVLMGMTCDMSSRLPHSLTLDSLSLYQHIAKLTISYRLLLISIHCCFWINDKKYIEEEEEVDASSEQRAAIIHSQLWNSQFAVCVYARSVQSVVCVYIQKCILFSRWYSLASADLWSDKCRKWTVEKQ